MTNENEKYDAWKIQETALHLCDRKYIKITLQFPDDLLKHAATVSFDLQHACRDRGHKITASLRFFCSILSSLLLKM